MGRKAEAKAACNEHFGTIKERLELNVTCTGIHTTVGYYGTTFIYKMTDSDGRRFTWFTSIGDAMGMNEELKIVGTIKKHDEWNGLKETHLSRVKVVE